MQGGAPGTHPEDGSPQMGLFQQPARPPAHLSGIFHQDTGGRVLGVRGGAYRASSKSSLARVTTSLGTSFRRNAARRSAKGTYSPSMPPSRRTSSLFRPSQLGSTDRRRHGALDPARGNRIYMASARPPRGAGNVLPVSRESAKSARQRAERGSTHMRYGR